MLKKLIKKIKSKKGFGSIEIVISAMVVIMMVAGLVDMIQITQRLDTASKTTGYVARVVQKQGGVQPLRIDNYNGKYTTTSVLYNNVKEMMEVNGIEEDDWTLKLTSNGNTYIIEPTTKFPLIDYGNRIKVTLETNFKWHTVSLMLPGEISSGSQSNREVLSGYRIRDAENIQSDLELN